jgi:hypothetical protein
MTEATEEVTTKRVMRPKAAAKPAPAAYQPQPVLTAAVVVNHKPNNGDLQAVTPRLLETLGIKAQQYGKTLADAAILVRTVRDSDGNWVIDLHAEFVQ